MLKKATISLCLALVTSVTIAQKYYTKTGELSFEASVAAFEPVAAVHNGATAVLDASTGKLAVLALIRGFHFRNATMEEHFNENYIESDTYPKASFTGIIEDFQVDNLLDKQEVTITGTITIREKEKNITTQATLEKKGGDISLQADFVVSPADFDIEIPKIVSKKITDTINVDISFLLTKK